MSMSGRRLLRLARAVPPALAEAAQRMFVRAAAADKQIRRGLLVVACGVVHADIALAAAISTLHGDALARHHLLLVLVAQSGHHRQFGIDRLLDWNGGRPGSFSRWRHYASVGSRLSFVSYPCPLRRRSTQIGRAHV